VLTDKLYSAYAAEKQLYYQFLFLRQTSLPSWWYVWDYVNMLRMYSVYHEVTPYATIKIACRDVVVCLWQTVWPAAAVTSSPDYSLSVNLTTAGHVSTSVCGRLESGESLGKYTVSSVACGHIARFIKCVVSTRIVTVQTVQPAVCGLSSNWYIVNLWDYYVVFGISVV